LEEHAKKHNTTVDDILEVSGYQARGELGVLSPLEQPTTAGDEKEYPFVFVDHNRGSTVKAARQLHLVPGIQGCGPGDAAWMMWPRSTRSMPKAGIEKRGQDPHHLPDRQLECTPSCGKALSPARREVLRPRPLGVRRVAAKVFGKEPREATTTRSCGVYDRFTGSTVRHAATRVKIEKI